jgi:hypothetical protein
MTVMDSRGGCSCRGDVAEVLQGAGEQSGTNEEHEAESHLQNDDGFPEADFAGVDVCGSS